MYALFVSGYDFTYSYDAMGRFEKIFLTNSGQLFQYYYDAASNETERHNIYNGVNQFYSRDALNRMQSMDIIKGTTLASEDYTYDAMDRITLVNYGTTLDSFTYYLDGELNRAFLRDLAHTLTYNLDGMGNRTSVLDIGYPTTTYSPNTINQYTAVSGSSISNGSEHEINAYNGVTYSYINDEHLTSVTAGSTTYSMVYDALGRCVKRSITDGPITYYIYDGEKPILEYDMGTPGGQPFRPTPTPHQSPTPHPSPTPPAINVYGKGVDEILLRVAIGSDGNWHTYYPQQNHEGSVILLTEASGYVIERYRYDAFGAPTIYDGNWNGRSATIYDNRFLFTGREYAASYRSIYTPAFNFYEYRARAYHPDLGRFMSEDPKLFDAGDYNLFRYCHNDPIDFTDPMGLQEIAPTYSPRQTSLERLWEMTKWFDRSNTLQGNFSGFTLAMTQSDRDAKGAVGQIREKAYTYSLKGQYNVGDLSGARGYQYVWDSNENYSGQCLTSVQHLTGTPSSSTPLLRGAGVGASTKQGTAIATGFRYVNGQWIYPSKPPSAFQAGEVVNHAVIYVAPIGGGRMQTLEAQTRVPIHLQTRSMEGWYEITSRAPPSAMSASQLRPWNGPIPW